MEIAELNEHIKSLNERLSEIKESDYVPTYKHKQLCKKVTRIANKYRAHMSFLWEWEGEVIPVDTLEHDVWMCVETQELIKRNTIMVAKNCLELSNYDLELTVVHEICHIFLRDLYISHVNELSRAKVEEDYHNSSWGQNEEVACWRFAKSILSIAGVEPEPKEKL
jgi:hypothetical protein